MISECLFIIKQNIFKQMSIVNCIKRDIGQSSCGLYSIFEFKCAKYQIFIICLMAENISNKVNVKMFLQIAPQKGLLFYF